MVGLSGGIGSGKSAVAQRLAELGAVIVDGDALARQVVAPGTEGLAAVVAAFGPSVLTPEGELDRAAVASLVFGDDEKRRLLESIIHPRVGERRNQIIAAAPPDAVVVNDIPLLVEAGMGSAFDLVIIVFASEQTRLARLVGQRGMDEADARARMAKQATDEQRRSAADVEIINEGTLDELRAQVDEVWETVIQPKVRS